MSPGPGEVLLAAGLSLGPAVVWLRYLRRLDLRHPAPPGRLALAFLAGALSTRAVLATSAAAEGIWPFSAGPGPGPLDALLYFVLAVGLVEESWKLLAVRLTVYRAFREPSDGLLYSGVAALGFATAENAVYILRLGDPGVLLHRWILSTFGHVLMALFWGWALGLTRCGPPERRRPGMVLLGLSLSALVHGLFDWFVILEHPILAVLLLLGLWRLFGLRVREAARLSPFRQALARAVRECPSCRALVRRDARFCTACGATVPEGLPACCPHCLEPVGTGSACPSCQAKLVPDEGG